MISLGCEPDGVRLLENVRLLDGRPGGNLKLFVFDVLARRDRSSRRESSGIHF